MAAAWARGYTRIRFDRVEVGAASIRNEAGRGTSSVSARRQERHRKDAEDGGASTAGAFGRGEDGGKTWRPSPGSACHGGGEGSGRSAGRQDRDRGFCQG